MELLCCISSIEFYGRFSAGKFRSSLQLASLRFAVQIYFDLREEESFWNEVITESNGDSRTLRALYFFFLM